MLIFAAFLLQNYRPRFAGDSRFGVARWPAERSAASRLDKTSAGHKYYDNHQDYAKNPWKRQSEIIKKLNAGRYEYDCPVGKPGAKVGTIVHRTDGAGLQETGGIV